MVINLSVLVVASAFMGMGLVALVRPATIMTLVDSQAATVTARNEVRAVYGGFGVCLALLLAMIESVGPGLSPGVYLAVGVALAGMALGRIISATIERPGVLPWLFTLIESAAALVLFSQLS